MENSIAAAVYKQVTEIPAGKVMTYGQIASICNVKNPRYIGYLLHHNPNPDVIPCHRVVNAKGACATNFAFGMAKVQEKLLKAEGVSFDSKGYVDLDLCQLKI